MTLQNSVVVITGASSGFGEAIARRCAARGASVVLAARSADKLERLAAEIGLERALAVPTDVLSDTDVARLARLTIERFGRADALVNNAGMGIMNAIQEASTAELQQTIDLNLLGAVRCTQAFLPHMLARRRGQIVMMASLASFVATRNMAFYAATKFALVGLSRAMMQDLAGTGVRCALVCPGVAMTDFLQRADITKYARIARMVTTTPEAVATATANAIERRREGEIVVPGYALPLARLANTFPAITRGFLRLVR